MSTYERGDAPPAALRTLHQVVARINADLDLDVTLQAVVDGVVTAVGFSVAVINLVRADGDLEVAAVAGGEEVRQALLGQQGARAEWDQMLSSGERWGDLVFVDHETGSLPDVVPSWVPDAPAADCDDAWHPLDALFAPMYGRSGRLLGVLSVDLPSDGRRPDAQSRQVLELFAAQAAFAVDNARVHAESAALLARVSAIVDSAPVAIYETDLAGRVRVWNAAAESILGWRRDEVLGSNVPGLEPDGTPLPSASEQVRRYETSVTRRDGAQIALDVACALLQDAGDRSEGYLTVAADISERKRLEAELRRQASTDLLTGLPNRQLFEDRLRLAMGRACRSGSAVAVLLVDLDGFKEVNDRYGHALGDEVLVEVGRRLAACVRGTDTVARLGGDEFVVVAEGQDLAVRAGEIGMRLVSAARRPIESSVGQLRLGASVGIALIDDWSQQDGGVPAAGELLRRADSAMYEAKTTGKDTMRWYGYPLGMSA